jgi:hypothetical protein
MALHGWYRADIMAHGIAAYGDQLGLRWDRILLAAEGTPAVHLGPASIDNQGTTIPSGHGEPTLTAPIDAETTLSAPIDAESAPTDDAGGAVPNLTTPADAADPAGRPAADLFSHPPYFASEPLHDSDTTYGPGDPAPPVGFILKGEALIWSGPAVMVFPGDPHDTASDAAQPDSSAAVTADLSAMAGGADLSNAFLPPGSDLAHPGHGLDPGFAFTPPPMPPPPDIIG